MPHTELDLRERRVIEDMLNAKYSISKIAEEIGKHRSTIYREVKRNGFTDDDLTYLNGYYGVVAHRSATFRRARRRKLILLTELRKAVIDRLKGGREMALAQYLPDRRKRRKSRYARKPRDLVFHADRSIHQRPDHVKDRATFGDWEGDLMIFRKEHGKANVASLIERKTRYALLFRNNDRSTKHLMDRPMTIIEPLPQSARKSITFDRCIEFSGWRRLENEIGTNAWFCDPQAPWQKGSVEILNKRARRYLPRDTQVAAISNRSMKAICDRLNTTPRKCLGWKTPKEAFEEELMKL